MRIIFIFITITLTSITQSQTNYYVDAANGNPTWVGLSCVFVSGNVGPSSSISDLLSTASITDGDIINIAAGNYNDTPTITHNITINGYIGSGGGTDVIFDLSAGDMVFNMTGVTTFTVGAVCGGTAADRFLLIGSTTTGIYQKTGDILFSSAIFNIIPPFLWRIDPPCGISGAESIPSEYQLKQNFPNPFNPTTNIRFTLPTSEFVILKIYNLLGEEISILLNETLPAGLHTINFDASGLKSGMYVYRIKAGGFSESKKMLLVK